MGNKTTKLDGLLEQAVRAQRDLSKLEGTHKLSFAGFQREASVIAGCDVGRIEQLERDLNERPGVDAAQAFVRRLSREFAEPRFPRPHPNAGKLSRIFGSEQADSQLAQLRATVAEAQVVAIRMTHKKHGDAVFGTVEDWRKHEEQTARLRETLQTLYAEMRTAYTGADVVIDVSYPAVTPSERGRGLCRLSFRQAEGISPATPDWPQQIIADAVANAPKKKPKREHLANAKAA